MDETVSIKQIARSIYHVTAFRPMMSVIVVALSFVTALLEGLGIGFLLPIIEKAQGGATDEGGAIAAFAWVYRQAGVPFTLEYIILGVALVMAVRFSGGYLVAWLTAKLRAGYVRELQNRLFNSALDAEIAFIDEKGADEILNAIVTQSRYGGESVRWLVRAIQVGFVCSVYLLIALIIAPMLTLFSVVVLGGILYVLRSVLKPGYTVGESVANANEHVQESARAGIRGIREVKLFGLSEDLRGRFQKAVNDLAGATVRLRRNEAVISNFYEFSIGMMLFALIYVALRFSTLSLGGIAVFLFAMFRLGPNFSVLNDKIYKLEGKLPHLVRTHDLISQLTRNSESETGSGTIESPIESVQFRDVSFQYEEDEQVLRDVSFSFERDEFIAFVGSSGAGKSTIASLLARLYDPDDGEILADGVPIDQFGRKEWRSRVSVVKQNPHIFNETLRFNVRIGNPDASGADVDRICDMAGVSEFVSSLPEGYETELGDDGVRLSGGQRQRVAIARALLKDADLLILDEATSDLDTTLERRIHRNIESMERDCAMIVIAHRLSTVTNADCIYTIEDGEIVERGSHEALLHNDGKYFELYASQS